MNRYHQSVFILCAAAIGLTLLFLADWKIGVGVLLCQWAQNMDNKLSN